jgi:hypothetical protein
MEPQIKTALLTGAVVGLVAVYDLPGSSFYGALSQAALLTYAVDKFAPVTTTQKLFYIGTAMSTLCGLFHGMGSLNSIKYGALTGTMAAASIYYNRSASPSPPAPPPIGRV